MKSFLLLCVFSLLLSFSFSQIFISGEDEVCADSCGYTYSAPTGPIPLPYQWQLTGSGGTIISGQNTESITVCWENAANPSVIVSLTLTPGNTESDTLPITVHGASIHGLEATCSGSVSSYSSNLTNGNTYSWEINGGVLITGQNTESIEVSWLAAGMGSVSLIQTNPLGCSPHDTLFVFLDSVSKPEILGPTGLCSGQVSDFSISLQTGYIYDWTVNGADIFSGASSSHIQILPTPGISLVEICLQVTNDLDCSADTCIELVVNPVPQPQISGEGEVCPGDCSQSYSVLPQSFHYYEWGVLGGTLNPQTADNITEACWADQNPAWVVVADSNTLTGCVGYDTLAVNIFDAGNISISGPSALCSGAGATEYTVNAQTGADIIWTVNGGTLISGQTNPVAEVEWDTIGSASLSAELSTSDGCTAITSIDVDIQQAPIPQIQSIQEVCEGAPGIYTTNLNPVNTLEWSVQGGFIFGANNTNFITVFWNAAGGPFPLCLTETSPAGCDSTVCEQVIIYPDPVPSISGPLNVAENAVGISYSTPLNTGSEYTWEVTGGTIIMENENEIQVTWGTAGVGEICVAETNPALCGTSQCITVGIGGVNDVGNSIDDKDWIQLIQVPGNPSFTIQLNLVQPENVAATMIDLQGREVMKLIDEQFPKGNTYWHYSLENKQLVSGFYIIRIQKGTELKTVRVSLP